MRRFAWLVALAALLIGCQGATHRLGAAVGIGGQPAASPNFTPYLATVSGVVATVPTQVHAFSCNSRAGTNTWAMVLNSASAIGNGATPTYAFLLPAGGMIVLGEDFFSPAGMYFSLGLAWGISTTNATYTAATAANHDCFFSSQ